MISVIVPALNAEGFLSRAVESALRQTYGDIEVLVCDAGSTDDTAEIAAFWARRDARVRLVAGSHGGVAAACNRGIAEARGEWVTFLDAEDTLLPSAYKTVLRRLGEREADLVIFSIEYLRGHIYRWPPNASALKGRYYPAAETAGRPTFIEAWFRRRRMPVHPIGNKLYRRSLLEELGLRFREDLDHGADRLFNFAYLKRAGAVLTVSDPLYQLNLSDGGLGGPKIEPEPNYKTLSWLAEQELELFGHFGYSDAELARRKQYQARALVKEQLRQLVDADRQFGARAVRRTARTLFDAPFPPPGLAAGEPTARSERLFLAAVRLRSALAIQAHIRLLQSRRTRGILQRRDGEIDRARELEKLGLESADKRDLSRYYFLADYEYFLDRINPEVHRYILRDKGVLLRRLAAAPEDFLRRPWVDLRRCSSSDFEAFLARAGSSGPIVAKRFDGHGSKGLDFLDVEDHTVGELHRRLIDKKHYIVEGFIAQHEDMARFYRPAVATLRIHTLNCGGDVSVVFRPTANFGSRGQRTNNPTSIQAFFDPRTGVIVTDGIGQGSRKHGERGVRFTVHPDTDEPFKGSVIPFAAEAEKMAKAAAKLVPELPFVGWDIAIGPDGPVVIEGNAAPMLVYSWQEMQGALLGERGMRRDFERVLARFERFDRRAKRRVPL